LSTIPASQIVQVTPSVLSAGGTGLTGIGLMLTKNTRVPIGTVQSFANAAAVSSFFGASSFEAAEAAIYFAGFNGASALPAQLLMAQYNATAVAAYLRGGNISGLSLSQLQALLGSLTIVVDGYSRTAASINLSAASSFSSAASLIQTGLNGALPTEASFTGSISGTTLSVTNVSSGAIAAGQTVTGTGVVTGTAGNTVVLAQLTGSVGGTGTYSVSISQTVISGAMTTTPTPVAVSYDSTSGAFVITSGDTGAISTVAFATGSLAASLLLTAATGAVLSQGAAAASPAAFMNALIVQNLSWVNFMTLFDPDGGVGNTVKQAFAAWKNTALGGNRFGYFCWDPDATPAASSNAPTSLGQILKANGDSGTLLIWEGGATQDSGLCAFALGLAAAINYQQTNGRTNFAFRSQAGQVANVTDPTTAGNLLANGYCFYGAYGAANAGFVWFQNGQITGPFLWADSWQTQVWLNTFFQTQLLTLFQNSLSVPFTTAGISLIQQTCQTVIQAGLAFGAFAPNTLTPGQIAAVNAAAGANIAPALQSQGYYLQVTLPPQTVQVARGPWPITFWWIDRNSVNSIDLSSVLVQ
jgi:Protein of unknown function (DUF3383)